MASRKLLGLVAVLAVIHRSGAIHIPYQRRHPDISIPRRLSAELNVEVVVGHDDSSNGTPASGNFDDHYEDDDCGVHGPYGHTQHTPAHGPSTSSDGSSFGVGASSTASNAAYTGSVPSSTALGSAPIATLSSIVPDSSAGAISATVPVSSNVASISAVVPVSSAVAATSVTTAGSPASSGTTYSSPYTLVDWFNGTNIFDEFTFFTGSDPTDGYVDYQDKESAMSEGLAYVTDSGAAVIKVDNTTTLSSGAYRDSVRISSNNSYDTGLFIADFEEMPWGCSLWPAYWTLGQGTWPDGGEIDVIEGVNLQDYDQITLHTSDDCTLDTSITLAADVSIGGTECTSSSSDDDGCDFTDSDTSSFGEGFNAAGGGVYAHIVNSTGIYVWFFSRSDIPDDIAAGEPVPDSWSTPIAFFSNSSCDIASHFNAQNIVLDITLCGDWAGEVFSSSTCASTFSTCADVVTDPSNYPNAAFTINYIKVFSADS